MERTWTDVLWNEHGLMSNYRNEHGLMSNYRNEQRQRNLELMQRIYF